MDKRAQRRHSIERETFLFFLCLGMLAVFFLTGIVLGQVAATRKPEAVNAELIQYLTDYCSLDANRTSAGLVFLSALLIYFRYPVLAVLMGLVSAGALLLPAVSLVFGFFLSFSVCCFVRAFGSPGVLLSAAVLGLRCLITLPCFLALAVPSLQRSATALLVRLTGHGKRWVGRRSCADNLLSVCLTGAVLFAGALAEAFLSPLFLKLVAGKYLF